MSECQVLQSTLLEPSRILANCQVLEAALSHQDADLNLTYPNHTQSEGICDFKTNYYYKIMNKAYSCCFVQMFSLVSLSLKIVNGFSFRKQLAIVATHKTAPRPGSEK